MGLLFSSYWSDVCHFLPQWRCSIQDPLHKKWGLNALKNQDHQGLSGPSMNWNFGTSPYFSLSHSSVNKSLPWDFSIFYRNGQKALIFLLHKTNLFQRISKNQILKNGIKVKYFIGKKCSTYVFACPECEYAVIFAKKRTETDGNSVWILCNRVKKWQNLNVIDW